MPHHQKISLNLIENAPLWNTHFSRTDDELSESVKEFGVLIPISVLKKEQKYYVIDGMARYSICELLKKEEIDCRVYNEDELNDEKGFLLCLELNKWSRDFNTVEKAYCLKVADEIFESRDCPDSFWLLVGIKNNARTIQQYRDLLKLSDKVLEYSTLNHLSMSVTLTFLRFKNEDVDSMIHELSLFSLNQNKLAEIVNALYDISREEKKSALVVLQEALSENENESDVLKREQGLRNHLKLKRNPLYEARLNEFESKVKSLPLNKKCKISPAPYFEDDYIEISTRFRSQKDINDFAENLKNGNLKDLLED